MPQPSVARAERHALADLMARLGPDAPTLCAGWTTRDLAAHVVLRDRRPDAAPGILVRPLAPYTERVQRGLAAQPYPRLVEMVRHPPWWSWSTLPMLDAAVNVAEFFIHHEDVRRAQPQWQPRELSMDAEQALWGPARMMGRLYLRRFPALVHLHAPGYGEVTAGSPAGREADAPRIRVSGPPGELLLFCSGRQRAARVEVTGPPANVEALRTARLGV